MRQGLHCMWTEEVPDRPGVRIVRLVRGVVLDQPYDQLSPIWLPLLRNPVPDHLLHQAMDCEAITVARDQGERSQFRDLGMDLPSALFLSDLLAKQRRCLTQDLL